MIFRWKLPMDIEPHDFPGYTLFEGVNETIY